MTIETDIKNLTKAIEGLTTVLTEGLVSKTDFDTEHRMETFDPADEVEKPKTKAKPKAKKPDPEPEIAGETEVEDDDSEDAGVVTPASVRSLAKDKINEGVERKDIKKLITDLGADAIGDLNQKGLAKLHAKLEAL